jgi:hypothetical protein
MRPRTISTSVLASLLVLMSTSYTPAQEASPASDSPTAATAAASSPNESLRGLRYCEVLVPETGSSDVMALHVYTSQGLNDCPLDLWDAVDARSAAKRLGVPMVFKNGPRYVAYDEITASIDGTVESFQELDMQLVATLQLPAGTTPMDRDPYTGMTVARETVYIYHAGNPVLELVDPDGGVYVMQTYVTSKEADGAFPDPGELAEQLDLPSGWEFREVVPDQDLHARTSNGQATVIRDNLGNTYQLLSPGSGTPVPES